MASGAYTKPKASSWGGGSPQAGYTPPYLRGMQGQAKEGGNGKESGGGWGTKPVAPENQNAWS